MKKQLIISVLLLITFTFGYSQSHRYNIIAKGQNVGVLTAVKIKGSDAPKEATGDAAASAIKENQDQIKVTSSFDVHLFIQVHVKYDMNCIFENGMLMDWSVETFKDDDLHSSSKGQAENGKYVIAEDGEDKVHEGAIMFSGAMLYFNEPDNIDSIFSEIHAKEKPVKKIEAGHYQIIDPATGQSNHYFYRDGVLQKAVIDHSLFSFQLVLAD